MFKSWIYKAAAQKVISLLPYADHVNLILQKHVTKGLELTDLYFAERLRHATNHIKAYKNYSGKSFPHITLELGTGNYMIIPVIYFLCGAETIYTVDIRKVTNKERLVFMLFKFFEFDELIKPFDLLPVQKNRIEILKEIIEQSSNMTFSKILEQLNIIYFNEDVSRLALKDNSIDLIHANNTFEFIETSQLKLILRKFKKIIKRDEGVISNFIDLSDHYSHFDPSISNYNFLKYSEATWSLIDNNLKRQNRLRITDYRTIYSNLKIPITEEVNVHGNMDDLLKVNINEKFKSITVQDLSIINTYLISKM